MRYDIKHGMHPNGETLGVAVFKNNRLVDVEGDDGLRLAAGMALLTKVTPEGFIDHFPSWVLIPTRGESLGWRSTSSALSAPRSADPGTSRWEREPRNRQREGLMARIEQARRNAQRQAQNAERHTD